MGKQSNRVNMVVTKQSIRYAYRKHNMQEAQMECGEVMLPEGTMKNGAIQDVDLFRETVARLVRKHRWRRKKLAFCLVDDTVYIQEVTIPGEVTASEALAYIETQTGYGIDLPFDNPSINIDVLHATHKMTRVRVYAYPKERIDDFEEAFTAAGLVPIIADLTSLSVYRYYEQSVETPQKHSLLVHWNRDTLYVTAFDRSKAVFTRHIKMDFTDAVRFDNASAAVQDGIAEIGRTVDYYHDSVIKGRARLENLIVSGDFPYLYEVKRLLHETLELPVFDFAKRKPRRKGASTRSTRGVPVHLEPESNKEMQFRVKYMDLLGLSRKAER